MRLVLTFFITLLLAGCSLINQKALSIQVGMGKQEVQNIMGEPYKRSFNGTTEAWQYTDFVSQDQCDYETIWFKNESVVALTSRQESRTRNCEQGIRDIDWSQIPMGIN